MKSEIIRCHRDFKVMMAEIKLSFLKRGKPAPKDAAITRMIAKKIKKDGIIESDKFIRF